MVLFWSFLVFFFRFGSVGKGRVTESRHPNVCRCFFFLSYFCSRPGAGSCDGRVGDNVGLFLDRATREDEVEGNGEGVMTRR